jgi:hypothetical protein
MRLKVSNDAESRLTPGLGFYLEEDGQWVVKEIPEDVVELSRFSGFLTIHGFKCSVFETPGREQWAQKSIETAASTIERVAARLATGGGNWVYHITFFNNLGSIEKIGLVPSVCGALAKGEDVGGPGKVFMTHQGGIPYWYGQMEKHARDTSDEIFENGHVPIVTRFMEPREVMEDQSGTMDALNQSYYVEHEIAPDGIEIWNGNSWAPIYEWDAMDPSVALNLSHYIENDEEVESYDFKPYNKNPLIPR